MLISENVKVEVASVESLCEAHSSVELPQAPLETPSSRSGIVARLRMFLVFAGPGYLVSVGYMDPGNWATDLEGGARFGFALLWVILLSSVCAMFLQTLCARLGIATGKDLAQACRDYFPAFLVWPLWIACEIAIIAMELAAVVGSAVALKLLFGVPLLLGVSITALDVFVLLAVMNFGFRKLEALIVGLVGTVALCFAAQIFLARPNWEQVAVGTFVPSMPSKEAFAISLGILGATVMPHNLYLHSSLVQTRRFENSSAGKTRAMRYNTLDTVLALSAAFFVNASLLIVAGAVFCANGHTGVSELEDAHSLLAPVLGAPIAATLSALALLASGQSSTLTGTLAGQVVMEGFTKWRIKPWIRRVGSRLLAIVPAVLLIRATGGVGTTKLLVFSQILLSMQLPFAIFPLVIFTSSRKIMGQWANNWPTKIAGFSVACVVSGLNIYLLYEAACG